MTQTLIRGMPCLFSGSPFAQGWESVTDVIEDGAVVIQDGCILRAGRFGDLSRDFPDAHVTGNPSHLLLPGFVDAHVHYPQTAIIASWGRRLIDWLNTYTFPEEGRFGDPGYARAQADLYLDLALANGTTTVASFCTIHPESVDAVFEAAAARGMAVVAGKTCMDRNAPEFLSDTAQTAYDQSKELIARWHGTGRATYAVTPRFAPTSSEAQLEAMGALWA
ncbi:MAG: amidohydrolase family protein, partial [Pseudomonadota bacterium]